MDTSQAPAPAAPAAAPAAPAPAKPSASAGPSTKEALLAAMLVQSKRQADAQLKTAKKGQAEVAQIKKTKQRTLYIIVALIGIVVFWIFKLMYDVRTKYKTYIDIMKKWHEWDDEVTGGVNDFGDPFKIAWAAEYPNFTTTLFSKTANMQYPTAVIRSLSIKETYDRMSEQDNPARFLNEMFLAASLDANKSANDIICEALVELNTETCWADCGPAASYTGGQVATDVLGTAASLALGCSMFLPVVGTAVCGAVGLVVGGVKAGVGSMKADEACSMNGANCRKTPQSTCY